MNPDRYADWIGRQDIRTDVAAVWPVAAMTATLGRDDPPPHAGDPLPLGWHWLYFLDIAPAGELGEDGHPHRGGFLPPVALPRRMWAGGRIEFLAPLRLGDALRRESTIRNVESKSGKSGDLVFVTVEHRIFGNDTLAVREEHDIVYRDAPKPGATPAKPAQSTAAASAAKAPWQRELTPDPVLLFRFSALTFNGHRIHYDLDYCRDVEGYPGLIVHGPLQTLLLLDLCRRQSARPVRRLEYRAQRPVFHGTPLSVNGTPSADGASAELWTADAAGQKAMTGTAAF
ncbi:MAG: FAS1-like dehydratase domain-containing protein [Burkholderiales bacterium]